MRHTISATHLATTLSASIGLLGSKKPYPVYFKTRFGIHTVGMTYPIDVLILDDTFCVQRIKENLKPNRLYIWPPHYSHVIELPIGYAKAHAITYGDVISLILH